MLPHDLDPANPIARRNVQRFADPAALARAAAAETADRLAQAVAARGSATIALAGGSTPKVLYRLLVEDEGLRAQLPWAQTHFFFGDERHVPPDHTDSNYRMASEAMLARAVKDGLLPEANIHRIPAEMASARGAAESYAAEIQAHFGGEAMPAFDVILLGMGPDGHTASVFPGTSALRERDGLVCAVWVDKLSTWRITFTPPLLRAGRCVLFTVAGADKARTLKAVLNGPPDFDRYPSQGIVSANGETLWFIDEAAAAEM